MREPEIVALVPTSGGFTFQELQRRRGKYEIPKPLNGHRKSVRLFLLAPRFKVSSGRGRVTVFCDIDGGELRETEVTFGNVSKRPLKAVVTNQPLVAVVVDRGQPRAKIFVFGVARNHHLAWLRTTKRGEAVVDSFPSHIRKYEQVARRAQALLE